MAIELRTRPASTLSQAQTDQGLRSYMLRVYNYMASGLALTGIVAYVVAHTGLYESLMTSGAGFIVMLAPLGIVFFMSIKLQSMKASTAQALFWVFSALMGASLAYVFMRYTDASVARVFFITAGTFGAASLFGYTTKRDLTKMGSFLMMGLFGIIIAMLVNTFLGSSLLEFVISAIGVIVFTGLTAFDTQRIKETYAESDGKEATLKKSIFGAVSLYLNFINLFVMLLHLTGMGGSRQ